MKKGFLLLVFVLSISLPGWTAVTYYSQGSIDPTTLANWNTNRLGGGSSPANFTSGDVFVIQNGHNMTTFTTWSISGTGSKLWIENGGTLIATFAITLASATTFQIDGSGTYKHQNNIAYGGSILAGTESFSTSSNFEINNSNATGPTGTAFGNLIINLSTPVNVQCNGGITTINGNFEIQNTSTSEFKLTSNTSVTLTVAGDLIISGGTLNFSNGSTSGRTFILNLGGNFNQTGGTFTHTNSTVGDELKINFTGSGKSFIQSAGTITSTYMNWDVNSGASLSLNNDLPVATSRSLTVNGTLDCGANLISGAGAFTVASGGTLKTAKANGITDAITVSGTKTFSSAANYEFNGAATGTFTTTPTANTANDFTINYASGVSLSQNFAVNGTLSLTSGTLTVGANTLTLSGNSPTRTSGNIDASNGSATVAFTNTGAIALPASTFTGNINNLTINGSGGVTLGSATTVAGTLALTSGTLTVGANTLTLNGAISSTSGTLTGGATSSITFGGSTGTTLPAVSGGLNDLTINRSGGITMGGGVSVAGTLTMQTGSLTDGGTNLTYGGSGTLKYDGTGYSSTSNAEFPTSSGPANLNVNNADGTNGLSLHANRTLSGTLTIASGNTFKIPASTSLTVSGALTNSAGNTGLVINDGGTLITNGSVSGGATMTRTISGPQWHLMSAPVSSQGIFAGYTDMYAWDEVNNSWLNKTGGTFPDATYLPGKGYLVSWAAGASKEFAGTLNSGDYTTGSGSVPALTFTSGQGNGYNLIGNPYPSAMNGSINTWTMTNVDNSIWVYDNGTYLTWNGTTGTLTGGIIPAMQGFWVKANASSPSATIPNSARTSSSQAYYKSVETLQDVIILEISGNGHKDGIVVNFNNEATSGYDGNFDVRKMFGDEAAPQLYCLSSDDQLSIDVLPYSSSEVVIPVNLKVGKDENYLISVKENTFFHTVTILLEDLKAARTINLQTEPSYSFKANVSDSPNRFILHFGGTLGIGDPQKDNDLRIYSYGKGIYISDITGKSDGQIFVYNLMGKQMMQTKINEGTLTKINLNAPTGYYMVKVITDQKAYSGKVFIK